MASETTCHCGHKYADGYHQLTGACYPAGLFGVSRTVDAERQAGIRAVGDASGCSGGAMGFHRCRCARCLYERGEGPKPPPVLPGVEFATAKADPAPSAEYAAECRACPACPDGICSRHHPDDREAAVKAHPEPAGMTALGVALTRSWAEHADPDPKAAPVDPYEAHRVLRLNEASRPVDCDPIDHRCYRTLADATERAVSALGMAREQKAVADQNLARLEAALSECGDPDAIAEHGRKAGGA